MTSWKQITILIAVGVLFTASCQLETPRSLVNFDHLNHLYMEVDLPDGHKGGIVHIYSEYPDYHYEIEADEGFACVDDVARALVLLSMLTDPTEQQRDVMTRLANFILYMQNENGYFNNFVWHDLSINTTYRTSIAEPNWWSWRAFWSLTGLTTNDQGLKKRIDNACTSLLENLLEQSGESFDTLDYVGVSAPVWQAIGPAGDQAAVLILGLVNYYNNISEDSRIPELIQDFTDGLMLSQKGEVNKFPYGAFLSWRNLWHAYGNIQAYAMLKAGQLLENDKYIQAALLEIENFYPFLFEQSYPGSFYIHADKADNYMFPEEIGRHQIAYNFRPMIWACLEAYELLGDDKYLEQALTISKWFAGENIPRVMMYDPTTGRCFDGIGENGVVNRNSGAESTIEALLSFQMIELYTNRSERSGIYDE